MLTILVFEIKEGKNQQKVKKNINAKGPFIIYTLGGGGRFLCHIQKS